MIKRTKTYAVLAGVSLVLTACTGSDDGDAVAGPETTEVAANIVQPGAPGEPSRTLSADELNAFAAPSYTAADVAFMQGMIHHHAQALRMTSLVPKRSGGTQIPLLARRMDITQESEIEQMRSWLLARQQPAPVLHRGHGHAHGIGAGVMPGMLSETQLIRLQRARGRSFDRLFLRFMIHHHEGALIMVDRLYAEGGGFEPEADSFARHVDADQAIEIARMKQLLVELG